MQDGISDDEAQLIPKLRTRLSEDLIPEWKLKQDVEIPYSEYLSYDRFIIGFGNFESTEWYFIFNDGERSVCDTNRRVLDFTENTVNVEDYNNLDVGRVRIQFSNQDAMLRGFEFYDR